MSSWLSGFETHTATISGERQTGTEDDGFGGTQPTFDTFSLTVDGRYEPNGSGLSRDFAGEASEDDPVFLVDLSGLETWDDSGLYGSSYGDYYDGDEFPADPDNPYVIGERDTIDIDGLSGSFEIRNIELRRLDHSDPGFVTLNPVRAD